MREYDEHDDLDDRTGSHGKCRREPIDVFKRGQLYNSGSECHEQQQRKLGNIRKRHVHKRNNLNTDLYTECSR